MKRAPNRDHDRLQRIRRFQSRLETRELDGFLVSKPVHLDYLHNFRGSAGVALHRAGEALLIVDSRYIEQATEEGVHCRPILAGDSILETLRGLLSSHAPGAVPRLGFEAGHLTHDWVERIKAWNAPCQWVATTDLIEELRAVKEPSEIAAIRDALVLSQAAYREILAKIRPGMRETELAGELELEMRKLGGEGTAFDTIVAAGTRSSLPHGVASQRVIREDDLVLVDFGVRFRSYNSDLTRVHFMPKASPPGILDVILEARNAAFAAIRPGVRERDIDGAARSVIQRAGHGRRFGHGLGHGLGLEVHELPRVSPRSHSEVREGMVFTIEPGIYLPGQYGIRIEDVVAVTSGGMELLSSAESIDRSFEPPRRGGRRGGAF